MSIKYSNNMKIYRVQLNDEEGTVFEFTSLGRARHCITTVNKLAINMKSPIRAKLIKP